MTPTQRRSLVAIAVSQLLTMTLWFSASAVTDQLVDAWGLTLARSAWITLAVQIGFVIGAFVSALLNLADVIPARRLFVIAAAVGVAANTALLITESAQVAIGLRFVTGVALAGLYPAGLKAMAGWFEQRRGMALGVLVGALTLGSATPHLIRGIGFSWQGVIAGASILAAAGGIIMARYVTDGPYEVSTSPFAWSQVGTVLANRGYRLATIGYLGHMWELYAMWTWLALFVGASAASYGQSYGSASVITFSVIAIGGLTAGWAGRLADRFGRTKVASGSLLISGSCALVSPFIFGKSPLLVIPILLIWGATVVADSAQFSTMVTETTDHSVRGTSLTLQTALGFTLTLVTIRLVPALADLWSWQWAFPILAIGPLVGIFAMVRLRSSPAAAQLAGGIG